MTAPWLLAGGLVLYVAAAVRSADEEQRQALREQVTPYLKSPQYVRRGDEQPVLDMVHQIMGHDWVPPAEWHVWLAAWGRNERGERNR